MKNKVLIIGGSGFIGSHVAEELIKKNTKLQLLTLIIQKICIGKQNLLKLLIEILV